MPVRVLFVCVVLLAGFSAFVQAEETTWMCPSDVAGQTLHVANWTTYIAPHTISTFEALCQVTVIYTEYETDEVVLTALRQGATGHDVVIPDNATIATMIEEGLLEPLDYSRIPNIKNVAPEFLNLSYDPENRYSIPYQWGTLGIGYRRDILPTPVTTWHDFFTSGLAVAWLDMKRVVLGMALLTLGYDPTTTSPTEIAAARNFLIENSQFTVIVPDSDGQALLRDGAVDLVIEFSGDIYQLNRECQCDDYGFVVPAEGTNIWADSMAIAADSPVKPLAETFIDYILDPQVSADISNATAYATPNQVALAAGLINPEYLRNPAIYPDETARNRMFFLGKIAPEVDRLYQNAWDEIRILLGK